MISVVIPAYNEVNAIEDTVNQCREMLGSMDIEGWEVVVVDDCSKDGTLEKLKTLVCTYVHHPQNLGYGRSLKDGILKAKNDTICITDADGTYPIEKIPHLYEMYSQGLDMVVGARTGKAYQESYKKRFLRWLLRRLVEYAAGRKIDDINSGLRMFSKKTVIPFFGTLCDTFSFTTSVTLGYMMTGRTLIYTPIEYHEREGQSKVKLFKDSLRTFQFILEAVVYYNPLKLFLMFSVGLMALSAVNFGLHFWLGWKTLVSIGIGCIFLAFMMFGFGMIGVILKQMLQTMKSNQMDE
jgi:glycosyltransferase involved in cell wall biosynthesis